MKIKSTFDPRSEPFRANRAAMADAVARLQSELARSKQGGSAKHDRRINTGRRFGMGRNMKIESTIDPRSEPFQANRAAVADAVARLQSELARSTQGGGAKYDILVTRACGLARKKHED